MVDADLARRYRGAMGSDRPIVAVVGAGLAGLRCADRLAPFVNVVLFEARDRVGGRCWSSAPAAGGMVAEHGGELIEAGQEHILALVRELGLELESREPTTPAPGVVLLAGRRLALDDIGSMSLLFSELERDLKEIDSVTRGNASDRAREIDEMSAQDWLDERLGSAESSVFASAAANVVRLNLGIDPRQLSALSVHHMVVGFGDQTDDAAFSFGNEVGAADGDDTTFGNVARAAVTHTFHVRGGNDQLAHGLAGRLPVGVLHLEAPVHAVRHQSDGRYVIAWVVDAGPRRLPQVAWSPSMEANSSRPARNTSWRLSANSALSSRAANPPRRRRESSCSPGVALR